VNQTLHDRPAIGIRYVDGKTITEKDFSTLQELQDALLYAPEQFPASTREGLLEWLCAMGTRYIDEMKPSSRGKALAQYNEKRTQTKATNLKALTAFLESQHVPRPSPKALLPELIDHVKKSYSVGSRQARRYLKDLGYL
jgi:hypothetical protein